MAGELIEQEGQVQIDDLLLGRGTPYGVKMVSGGSPPMRTNDRDLAGRDGSRAGQDFHSGRPIRAMVNARERDGQPVGHHVDVLVAKFQSLREGTVELAWWRWGDPAARVAFVRPRRIEADADHEEWSLGIKDDIPMEFFAPDRRWYSLDEHAASLSPPEATAGRTYDRTYPLAYGGGTGSSRTLTNAGEVPTHPTFTIHGPVTNPRLENVTTAETLELAIAIADGEFLEVDMYARTVLLGGTGNRYASVQTASFWALDPGDNEVRFSADSGGDNGADVVWRDAWH